MQMKFNYVLSSKCHRFCQSLIHQIFFFKNEILTQFSFWTMFLNNFYTSTHWMFFIVSQVQKYISYTFKNKRFKYMGGISTYMCTEFLKIFSHVIFLRDVIFSHIIKNTFNPDIEQSHGTQDFVVTKRNFVFHSHYFVLNLSIIMKF